MYYTTSKPRSRKWRVISAARAFAPKRCKNSKKILKKKKKSRVQKKIHTDTHIYINILYTHSRQQNGGYFRYLYTSRASRDYDYLYT